MNYIYPCLPNTLSPTAKYFDELDRDIGWIGEVKKNGWRAVVMKSAGVVTIWTRHKTRIKYELSQEITDALQSLPDETLIDGELIFTRRVQGVPDGLYLFDAIMYAADPLWQLPLIKRRGILEIAYRDYLCCPSITLSEMVRVGKKALYEQSIEGPLNEGIVLKHLGSPYPVSDRKCMTNTHWLKVKKVEDHIREAIR